MEKTELDEDHQGLESNLEEALEPVSCEGKYALACSVIALLIVLGYIMFLRHHRLGYGPAFEML